MLFPRLTALSCLVNATFSTQPPRHLCDEPRCFTAERVEAVMWPFVLMTRRPAFPDRQVPPADPSPDLPAADAA
ncbi:hypothetical protein H257_09436 [Aphanomyces astaci]|uniref:Secreted protein n=1 Tax=Aphanomyces astaci TaxID=112090 RepID=W4GAT2_APHAT|nr:hypothetical protein H257_09436 [Aphanomyces astaci]ETV76406.1 hypothetical protein H257_09436 [Aphanomyces astaci]|eukprot:XP_009833951.1 hypothetical protein H257_09436 [Aphanomyces astaci]